MSKKAIFIIVIICIAVLALSLWIFFQFIPKASISFETTKMFSAFGQTRTVMTYIYSSDGHYDNFNCNNNEMKTICSRIDELYGGEDGKEPTITYDSPVNSQGACIYSLIECDSSRCREEVLGQGFWYRFWNRGENYWLCADTTGRVGYTKIDPTSSRHCIDGEIAVCPYFFEFDLVSEKF